MGWGGWDLAASLVARVTLFVNLFTRLKSKPAVLETPTSTSNRSPIETCTLQRRPVGRCWYIHFSNRINGILNGDLKGDLAVQGHGVGKDKPSLQQAWANVDGMALSSEDQEIRIPHFSAGGGTLS